MRIQPKFIHTAWNFDNYIIAFIWDWRVKDKFESVVETNEKILLSEDSDESDDDIPSLSDHEEPPSTPDPNLETEDNTNETSENVPKIFNTENDTVNPYLNDISKNEKLVQSEEANHMEHMEVENEATKESDENIFLNAIKENTAQHSTFSPDMNLDAEGTQCPVTH